MKLGMCCIDWITTQIRNLSNTEKASGVMWLSINLGLWWFITGVRCLHTSTSYSLSELWFPGAIWWLGALVLANVVIVCALYLDG